MPMFEYLCECGKRTEKFLQKKKNFIKCECGKFAEYRISAPFIDYLHTGIDPHGAPTSGDKWARIHERAAK